MLSGWLTKRLATSSRTGSPRLKDVLGDRLDAPSHKALQEDFAIWLQSDDGKGSLDTAEAMATGLPHGVALRGWELSKHVRDEAFAR